MEKKTPAVEDMEAAMATPDAKPDLKYIRETAGRAVELQRTIEDIEEMLKQHKKELHEVTTRELPDAMAAAGLDSFKTDDGDEISVKDFISGTLPKDERRDAAIAYLEALEAGDIIKHRFQIDLGRGEHNAAGAIRDTLSEIGASYSEKEDVHPQTLAAFARERLKSGEEVDLDKLGLYAGRAAKIKLSKKGK